MSNQIGLLFSFIFLTIFISFTNEILNYQKFVSNFNLQTNQIAFILQSEGKVDEDKFKDYYNFKDIEITSKKEKDFVVYQLIIITEYESISDLYQFLNKDIVNSYKIYRRG